MYTCSSSTLASTCKHTTDNTRGARLPRLLALAGGLGRGLLDLRWLADGLAELLGLQHLDDLLLIDQECTDDALAQTPMAQDATEGTGHGLQTAAHTRAFARPRWLDSAELLLALAAFWHGALLLDVQVHQAATGRADNTSLVGFGVVRQTSSQSQSLDHLGELA